jgi:hypothetical protein
MIFTLVYVSDSNLLPFGDLATVELDKIAKSSGFNNDIYDVRGFLFYYQNKFLQILQGEFDSIISVFAKIKDDPRHHNVRIVWFSSSECHAFKKWSMLYSIEYACENFKKLTVQSSSIARFVPDRGHLTPQAYQLLLDVATQSLEELGQSQEKLLGQANA